MLLFYRTVLCHLFEGQIAFADTIPGRQSMASCFLVLKQFTDAMVYLNSIKVPRHVLLPATNKQLFSVTTATKPSNIFGLAG